MSDLSTISKVFLKLGTISFGGPAAHISMMENEVVKKKAWMGHSHFLDLVGATNLIPGPNSTEMAMHCGFEKAGIRGLFVAGISFILPAVIISAVFAIVYQKYGKLPEVEPFIYGIKPAVIAVIFNAAYTLGKKALKSLSILIIGFLALFAILSGINEIVTLFASGFLGMLIYFVWLKKRTTLITIAPFLLMVENLKVFSIFLKVGAVLFGSGFVLFGLLDSELVEKGLLTHQQLMDAIAVGQFTPGPVLSSATFVGWLLNGWTGALVATVGIFLPSFFFVWLLNPLIPKMRNSKPLAAFLDAINIASIALIFAVGVKMTMVSFTDWKTITITLLGLAILLMFRKVNNAIFVMGGSLAGYILWLI
jgi:chromate transporter